MSVSIVFFVYITVLNSKSLHLSFLICRILGIWETSKKILEKLKLLDMRLEGDFQSCSTNQQAICWKDTVAFNLLTSSFVIFSVCCQGKASCSSL